MRNALFYVAKDPNSDNKDKVLGVAMWMPPKPAELKKTWAEWWEGWKLWTQQVRMNLYYGRGGLNVKVRLSRCLPHVRSGKAVCHYAGGEVRSKFEAIC